MHRSKPCAATPTNDVRRRYQATQDHKPKNGFHPSARESSLDGSGGLELSMHLPNKPRSNRFDVLATPSSPTATEKSDKKELSTVPCHRRVRQRKETREAKRRRDARRQHKEVEAARTLDEQLSRDIDRVLAEAVAQRPPPARASPPKALPTPPQPPSPAKGVPAPITRVPSEPPQLPLLRFSGLDLLSEIPQLTPPNCTLKPFVPADRLQSLQSWCPTMHNFIDNCIRWGDYPTYFDLSKLPEPAEPVRTGNTSREMRLWRPKRSPQPKKISRFFPAPPSDKPALHPLSTACRLHVNDKGTNDAAPPKPKNVAESVERVVEVAETKTNAHRNEHTDVTAANLWSILVAAENCSHDDGNEAYINSFSQQERGDTRPILHDHRMETVDMPAEQENTQIPYVNSNCLTTDHANERASLPFSECDDLQDGSVIFHSPKAWTPPSEEDDLIGLNELMVDNDPDFACPIAAAPASPTEMPPLPPSPHLEGAKSPITDALLVDYPPSDAGTEERAADFIFDLPSPAFAQHTSACHPISCWCDVCAKPPALLTKDALPAAQDEDIEGWVDASLIVEEEEWLPEWAWEDDQDEDAQMEKGEAGGPLKWPQGGKLPRWESLLPCHVSSLAHRPW